MKPISDYYVLIGVAFIYINVRHAFEVIPEVYYLHEASMKHGYEFCYTDQPVMRHHGIRRVTHKASS